MAVLRVDPIPASNHSTSPPGVRRGSSVWRTARIVGILFLAGYLAYGVGSLIAQGVVRSADGSGSTPLFVTGAALMLLNSALVIGIGVLMLPILRPHSKAIAAGYLGTRIFEGVCLAIGVVSLIVLTGSDAINANSVFYNVGEAGLAIGSLFFCALLFRTRLVPRFLAAWGFLGYACFAGGTLLELFGVAGAGVVGAIPGGLFELTFGIWLIVRGFASTATVRGGAVASGAGEGQRVTIAYPALPTSIAQCQKNGWKNFGTKFKNQGQCVKFVETRLTDAAR